MSDAKWFLALRWCDLLDAPAGIVNNTGELAFFNQVVLKMGEENFIPQQYRLDVFSRCLSLQPNEKTTYQFSIEQKLDLEIQALEIDARYGKVALVSQLKN